MLQFILFQIWLNLKHPKAAQPIRLTSVEKPKLTKTAQLQSLARTLHALVD